MNKYFCLSLLFLLSINLTQAQDVETSSEVVDPMSPTVVPEVEINPPVTTEVKEETPTPETLKESEPVPPTTPIPMVTSEVHEHQDFNPRKGHWITTFGIEGIEYEVPLNFQGTNKTFEDQKRNLYGARLGFGREFYLGWGFNTTTKLEGFYMGTLFESATDPNSDETGSDDAFVKKTGNIYGGEASQSLGFMFDLHTRNPFLDEMTHLIVEPYVFAGVGQARAYNRLSYHYDDSVQEDYRIKVQDSMTTASVGGGINFTSPTGFFLYLKATQYRLNITKRKEEGYFQPDGQAVTSINQTLTEVDSNPITVYALGGGYKF